MAAERKVVRLPWGEVSYLEWSPDGAARAPTLLLLHGGGLDSAELSWADVGPAVAQVGYRVLAPDHPGYGESPPARTQRSSGWSPMSQSSSMLSAWSATRSAESRWAAA